MQRLVIKLTALLVLFSFSLVGCNLPNTQPASVGTVTAESPAVSSAIPTAAVEATEQPVGTEPADNSFSYEGISLQLDPAVAAGARGETLPENPGTPGGPYWDALPQYVRISLDGYPLEQKFFEPVISVYPVADYRRISEPAGTQLDRLQAVLDQQPPSADQFPFLPVFNAGQVFHSNVAYLAFQNGIGVRYLTIFAQYPAPVNNFDLFYTFQGLTDDGQTLVTAILPVNHPTLPADPNALSSGEMDNIVKNYDAYRADQAAGLSSQPGSSFTPDLDQLDALIQSLHIEQ